MSFTTCPLVQGPDCDKSTHEAASQDVQTDADAPGSANTDSPAPVDERGRGTYHGVLDAGIAA